MGTQGILDSMLEVAKAAIPIIGRGGIPLAETVELGAKIVAMVDAAKGEGETIPPALGTIRDELDRRINSHVDDTVSRLRGEQ